VNATLADGRLTLVLYLSSSLTATDVAGSWLTHLGTASTASAALGISVLHSTRIMLSQDVGKPTPAPTAAPTAAPSATPTAAPTVNNVVLLSTYVGCYADPLDPVLGWGGPRDFEVGAGIVSSVGECKGLCSGYMYLFVQNGNECSCGNSYGSQGLSTGCQACSDAADAASGLQCGGGFINSVYRTSPPPSAAPTLTPSVAPSAPSAAPTAACVPCNPEVRALLFGAATLPAYPEDDLQACC